MAFSVGIGLTNECDLRCAHCYRPDAAVDRLTLADVQRLVERIPIRSLNLGVGENGLHPDYEAILELVWARGIKTSITSNGLSIQALPDAAVRRFHSVEFSLDFPTEREHDAFRGTGNWRTVETAMERCAGLGVPVTVTAVMMKINVDRLPALARVAAGRGANLRVNIYQPSKTDRFSLSYTEFWEGFRRLLRGGASGRHDRAGSGRGPGRPRLHGPRLRALDGPTRAGRSDPPLHLLAGEPAHARGPGYARGRHHEHAGVPGGDRAARRLRQLSVPGRVRRAPRGARPPGGARPLLSVRSRRPSRHRLGAGGGRRPAQARERVYDRRLGPVAGARGSRTHRTRGTAAAAIP